MGGVCSVLGSRKDELVDACARGDLKEVRSLLPNMSKVDFIIKRYKSPSGGMFSLAPGYDQFFTPLMQACPKGGDSKAALKNRYRIVKEIMNHPNSKYRKDKNLARNARLYFASIFDDVGTVRSLLKSGADVNWTVDTKEYPDLNCALSCAFREENWKVVRYLLKQRRIDTSQAYGMYKHPLLHTSCHQNMLEVLLMLLRCDSVDVNHEWGPYAQQFTPLEYAVHHGLLDVVKELLFHPRVYVCEDGPIEADNYNDQKRIKETRGDIEEIYKGFEKLEGKSYEENKKVYEWKGNRLVKRE